MPKPIFATRQKEIQQIRLQTTNSLKADLSPLLMDKRLREKRSDQYMEMMKQLDLCGSQLDQSKYQEFLAAVREEFSDIVIEDFLLGIVAKCYLGKSYEVHTLDLAGNIVVHYKVNEPIVGSLDRARSLALHGGYLFVEVYNDSLRAVKANGTVVVVK